MQESSIRDAGFFPAQGAPLYYEVAGPDEPESELPVLFLHAGIADCRMWDDQFAAFTSRYRLVRYDLRGFGKSAFPSTRFANFEDPAQLLRHLNIPRAHVVAASYGGLVALDFALSFPEMVASLTLVNPSVGGIQPPEEVRRFGAEEGELLEKGDVEGATELNMRMWVDGPSREALEVNSTVRQRVYEMQYQAFKIEEPEGAELVKLDPPASERLGEITAPTLAIFGELDWPAFFQNVSLLAEAIPNAQALTLAGGAHMVSMEQPEEFNRLLLEFWRSLEQDMK